MKTTIFLIFASLLSGCVTPEMQAQQRALQAQQAASLEASEIEQCKNMGAGPKTKNYYDCRKTLTQQRFETELRVKELYVQQNIANQQSQAQYQARRNLRNQQNIQTLLNANNSRKTKCSTTYNSLSGSLDTEC